MFALLLAVVFEPAATAADQPAAPPQIFLHPAADECVRPGRRDEVVVCGAQDSERYRLRPIEAGAYSDEPVRAEMGLGGGTLSVHNEDKELGGGQHSKRAMITFTLPF